MKAVFLILLLEIIRLSCPAQNLTITFTGNGAADHVEYVTATNLKTGQSITFPGNETLTLVQSTGIHSILETEPKISVYPNPFAGNTTVSINAQVNEEGILKVQDIFGKVVSEYPCVIEAGRHNYNISVSSGGIFLLSLIFENHTSCIKIISTGPGANGTRMDLIGSNRNDVQNPTQLKSGLTFFSLAYSPGDRIHYRCLSGIYSTHFTDVPVESKTYQVEFVPCTDADGRNYPIVAIGTQTWMAENLAFLPEVNSPVNGSDSAQRFYVSGYAGTDIKIATQTANYQTYGVLYNWAAAMNSNSGSDLVPSGIQGHCPEGWHLPGDSEWRILTEFLSDSSGFKLKSDHGWTINANGDNSTGFNALPAGYRNSFGGFEGTGSGAYYWSATSAEGSKAWNRYLYYISDGGVGRVTADKNQGFSVRCLRGYGLPVVTTAEVTEITNVSAICGGEVVEDGGSEVAERGVCWSLHSDTQITDNKTIDGSGIGVFTSHLTNLTPGTTNYYVRAYAINGVGISYGDEIVFNTTGTVYPPRILTAGLYWINQNEVKCGGNVTYEGGAKVTARGVCWNLTGAPTTTDEKTEDGEGSGAFTSILAGLTPSTTYYVRAYATNSGGTSYGDITVFKTWEAGLFTDERDGHQYKWVKIGTQVWMAENLAWLPAVSPPSVNSENDKLYYVYGYTGTDINEAKTNSNYLTYGVLYNNPAALNGNTYSSLVPSGIRGACPAGWHLPSKAESQILIGYLGGSPAMKLREIGNIHWTRTNNGTNECGFSSIPGGFRHRNGTFQSRGINTSYKTATKSDDTNDWYWGLDTSDDVFFWTDLRSFGDAVRCIKD